MTKRRSQSYQQPLSVGPPGKASRRWAIYVGGFVLAISTLAAVLLIFGNHGKHKQARAGVPYASEYHSLLVAAADPQQITLGTHDGLYVSEDGGKTWRFASLPSEDAMNLARSSAEQVWVAGHNLLKKSVDGGRTWSDVQAAGLPTFDVHAFAVDPRGPTTLYAAVADQGLFRSIDGGRSFSRLSRTVGADVTGLTVTKAGRIFASDPERGLLTRTGGAAEWRRVLDWQVFGVAASPNDSRRVVAAGAGVALSTDGGRRWRSVLNLPGGAGPVAWSPSDTRTVYVLGFDGTLYRSRDAGETWRVVTRAQRS